MKTILFFDTETTGLVKDTSKTYLEPDNYPRLVQLAYELWLVDDELHTYHVAERCDYLIRPKGFTITPALTNIHGITPEKALKFGSNLGIVLERFVDLLYDVDLFVAYGLDFDLGVILSELIRVYEVVYNMPVSSHMPPPDDKGICLMKSAAEMLKIPKPADKLYAGEYKYLSLEDLHNHFFRCGFRAFSEHDAAQDVRALTRCFSKMYDMHTLNSKINGK